MTKIKDLTRYLETIAPLAYQESYDNSGLLVGNPNTEIKGVLISLDCTEEIVREAVEKGCNVIVSHHPIVFKGLKKFTGSNYVERTVILAIKNDVALYAIHTNLDNVLPGVNRKLAEKIGLQDLKILDQKLDTLTKLVTFTPKENREDVLAAMHKAGAGNIGDYNSCSFRSTGTGRFVPGKNADPHIGEPGKMEEVEEERIEVIFPTYLKYGIIDALTAAHPYEEVAYYLTSLQNANQETGSGMIGSLEHPMPEDYFIERLKEIFGLKVIRHTKFLGKPIKKVAVCGGSGSFLTRKAISKQADIFITSDIKYHEYFDAEDKIILADIGHYESEIATTELLEHIIKEKFTTFAVCLTTNTTNPILYT